MAVVIVVIHQVIHGRLVTAPKSLPVIFARAGVNVRVAILGAIVHIGAAMLVEILASAFNPIVKSLALNIAELGRGNIPTAVILLCNGRCRGSKERLCLRVR